MRIDPESTLGGYPVLQVRNLVRKLNNWLYWDSKTIQAVLCVGPREATGLVSALEASGLAKLRRGTGPSTWTTTPLAQSFGSATAAKPITRKTAETALARLLERIERVNRDNHFLAKVTRVIVFGSYLRADVDRLGDVDVAVELEPKEAHRRRLRESNYRRLAESERKGHRFSGMLDREMWWQLETFRFLKSRSRSISLHDYRAEKQLVDEVPHRILMSLGAKSATRGNGIAEAGPEGPATQRLPVLKGWPEFGAHRHTCRLLLLRHVTSPIRTWVQRRCLKNNTNSGRTINSTRPAPLKVVQKGPLCNERRIDVSGS